MTRRNSVPLARVCAAATIAVLSPAGPARAQSVMDMARGAADALGAQGRVLWIDGTANIFRTVRKGAAATAVPYTTSPGGVREIVEHCKAAHINIIVVDVKPLSGQVLYASSVAPRMTQWQGHAVPNFDVLAAFVEQGHRAGLLVDAAINVFSEGHKYYSVGPAYQHADWQSIVYTVDRGLVGPDGARLPVRVPNEPCDAAEPAILTDNDTILPAVPSNAMVGLESTERAGGVLNPGPQAQTGRQLNVVLDADNTIVGVVDSALLGDDPLVAPEEGHIVPVKRAADRAWVSANASVGAPMRFDLRTALVPVARAPSERVACFVNPLIPDVRRYEIAIAQEVVSKYDVDGLVLDRCRYADLYNDYSDVSRQEFSRWLGRPVTRWPEDVLAFSPTPGQEFVQGPLYPQWLQFRSETMRDFVADLSAAVRSIKPRLALATYVGSWYPKYYELGVNWGSKHTPLRYSWFTPDYPRTGYADFFDWISTGCYYPTPTLDDARRSGGSPEETVEYSAQLSNTAVANASFVYAGVYVPDYAGRPDALIQALRTAATQSQGWMIFDLSYLDEYDWWPVLERAFPEPAVPPDRIESTLSSLRTVMDTVR